MLDRFRLEYLRRASTPNGRKIFIRARRRIDTTEVEPGDLLGCLPLFILIPWKAYYEFRHKLKYKRIWVVEVYPPGGADNAQVIGEAPKYEAFRLADTEAARLESGP